MNRFVRFYNQNKEQLWFTVLIILLIVLSVRGLNAYIKNKNINTAEIPESNTTTVETKRVEKSKTSAITDKKVEDKTYEKQSNVIENFINHCNNKKVEAAYALLTDECKETMYPTIEDFDNYYVKVNFATYKEYTIQNYYNDIYKIRLLEDMLSTGKSNNGAAIQDYFTIVNNKLNINSYIRRTEINSESSSDGVTIKVMYRDVFMDYEEYAIEVTNGTGKTIKLDSLEGTKSMYLVNSKGVQFPSYSHELVEAYIELPQGNTRQMKVKFYNNYVTTNQITKMVFEDVILDYDEYVNCTDKTTYKNRTKCEIEI